jgi:hypothetical protein
LAGDEPLSTHSAACPSSTAEFSRLAATGFFTDASPLSAIIKLKQLCGKDMVLHNRASGGPSSGQAADAEKGCLRVFVSVSERLELSLLTGDNCPKENGLGDENIEKIEGAETTATQLANFFELHEGRFYDGSEVDDVCLSCHDGGARIEIGDSSFGQSKDLLFIDKEYAVKCSNPVGGVWQTLCRHLDILRENQIWF